MEHVETVAYVNCDATDRPGRSLSRGIAGSSGTAFHSGENVDLAAYVIGKATVTNDSWVEEYIPKVQALVESYGGRYIARNTEIEKLEGPEDLPTVAVVIEFPSLEQAKEWYDSEAYQPFLKARQGGSISNLILLDGL